MRILKLQSVATTVAATVAATAAATIAKSYCPPATIIILRFPKLHKGRR